MSIRKYVQQVRPIQENYIEPIDKIHSFLSELTISPNYVMKGVEKVWKILFM